MRLSRRLAEFMRKMTSHNAAQTCAEPCGVRLLRADEGRLPRPRGAGHGMIRFSFVEHHIEDRAHARLCDGSPASDADISSEDWDALRDARRDATLCPDCQDRVNPRVCSD